jgi:hypothetical protein
MKIRHMVALAALCFFARAAAAADIHVLALSLVKPVIGEILRGYEQQTGNRLVYEWIEPDTDLGPLVKEKKIDAVIASNAQVRSLAAAYRILPDTRRTIGYYGNDPTLIAAAGIRGTDHEDDERSLTAYLLLFETVHHMQRRGFSAP